MYFTSQHNNKFIYYYHVHSNLSNHCLKSFIIARNGTFLAICASDYLDVFYQIRFWNYHLYKYGSLILLALNDLIIIQKFIMSSFYPSLIHFLSIIPVGEHIGKDMIITAGRFLVAGLPPLIPIYIGCKLWHILFGPSPG